MPEFDRQPPTGPGDSDIPGGSPSLWRDLGPEFAKTLSRFTDQGIALRWIVWRVSSVLGCRVALLDISGPASRVIAGDLGGLDIPMTLPDVRLVRAGTRPSATVAIDGRTVQVVGVRGSFGTVLAVADGLRSAADVRDTVFEVSWAIGVYLRSRQADEADRVLAETRTRMRAVIFQLLCAGNTSAAQQVAGGLGRRLPDPVRLCVIEGLPQRAREKHRGRPEVLGDAIWTFRATVQHDAGVLLSAANDQGALEDLVLRLATRYGCRVGMSDVVALRDTGTGYEQALHALYTSRGRGGRPERFKSRTRLAGVVDPGSRAWAAAVLRNLLMYEPPRRTAPDADELLRTAQVWLRLAQHGPRDLDIHRNTIRDRLRLIGQLLGADLNRVADQSVVSLALRIHRWPLPDDAPRHTGPPPTLTELLDGDQAVSWARIQLRPLSKNTSEVALPTVRTWLDHDASVAATAQALGLSVSATRKRLTRVGMEMNRSLLELPGARHDLWIALLVHDRAVARAAGREGPAVPEFPRFTPQPGPANLEVS